MGLQSERVILVTGASRGIGRGTAVALAAPGTTIYVTGRTTEAGVAPLPGTIHETAAEIARRGGRGIAVACDHADDAQVGALFRADRARVRASGSAWSITSPRFPMSWCCPGASGRSRWRCRRSSMWVCARTTSPAGMRARMMVPQRAGLIVMISSPGARCYLHGPAYGAGKAGIDKMSADMAQDLKKHGVACVSLWAALTLTERSQVAMREHPGEYDAVMANAVHPEFMGRLLDALLQRSAARRALGQDLVRGRARPGARRARRRRPPAALGPGLSRGAGPGLRGRHWWLRVRGEVR